MLLISPEHFAPFHLCECLDGWAGNGTDCHKCAGGLMTASDSKGGDGTQTHCDLQPPLLWGLPFVASGIFVLLSFILRVFLSSPLFILDMGLQNVRVPAGIRMTETRSSIEEERDVTWTSDPRSSLAGLLSHSLRKIKPTISSSQDSSAFRFRARSPGADCRDEDMEQIMHINVQGHVLKLSRHFKRWLFKKQVYRAQGTGIYSIDSTLT